MTSKKAQGLGFIIVLVISIFAVVGVVVGTVQVWEAMACTMGAPLRLSFAPHVGNLRAQTVLLDIRDTTFGDYVSIYNACNDPDNFVQPEPPFTPSEVQVECAKMTNEICPLNQTCIFWSILMIYNGVPEETGDVFIGLFHKVNIGSYDYTTYPSVPLDTISYQGLFKGDQRDLAFSSAYVNDGVVVGEGTMAFVCTGSFIKIEASADKKVARLEETKTPHPFCLVPKIAVQFSESLPGVLNVTTNVKADCYYQRQDPGSTPYVPTIAALTKLSSLDNILHTAGISQTGRYYVLCTSLLDTTSGQVWVNLS